jgi:4-amino-4-deoxy-L-arabinose transferase-like glycosyltransferase
MTEKARARAALALGLGVYAILAARAAWTHRNWINPDAVSYLRNALYWTEGRWIDAISGYWSPLFSLCVAPWLALGCDPLHAAITAVAVWGALLLLAVWMLIRRLGRLSAGWTAIAMLLCADTTVRWGTTLFPDVILAACLMGSASMLMDDRTVRRRGWAMAAGVLGGLGYLAKAYGFPFFLVFLPMSLAALHAPWGAPRAAWRPVARAWGWGMAGFAVLAVPWVLALSLKFGHPTTGLAGPINHAIVGPRDPARDELWRPVPGRVTVWETPETRTYGYWSPLESASSFRWQAGTAWGNGTRIVRALSRFDRFALALLAVVLGPFLAWRAGEPGLLRFALWIAGTFAVFSAGFAFVYFDYRYTAPFLKPLAIIAMLVWADALGKGAAVRWARSALLALVCVTLGLQLNVPFRPYVVEEPAGTPFDNITIDAAPHRALAHELAAAGIRGPVASSFYWGGMFTAYWWDVPFVGLPAGQDAAAVRDELRAVGAAAFLVDPAWPLAGAFVADRSWRLAHRTAAAGQAIDVYVPAAPPPP